MNNVKNLVSAVSCVAMAAIPFRKGWALEATQNKGIRNGLLVGLMAVATWNLYYWVEGNSNMN